MGQAADEVERRPGTQGRCPADGLGGVERERPRQHGQPPVRDPLVGGGEAEAPVDLLVQVPLPGRAAAQPGQRARFAAQPVGDLVEGEHPDPGRGEPIPSGRPSTATQMRAIARPSGPSRSAGSPRALTRSTNSATAGLAASASGVSATGSASGANFWSSLAVDSQGLAARGEHRDRRRGLDERLDGGRDSLDDLLAVVQQQEHRPFGGEVAQRVEGGPARAGVEAESGGHAAGDPFDGTRFGVGDRRQVHEPHAVGGPVLARRRRPRPRGPSFRTHRQRRSWRPGSSRAWPRHRGARRPDRRAACPAGAGVPRPPAALRR